jgi:hypothetical protein
LQRNKKNQGKPVAQRDAVTSHNSSTESGGLNASELVKELANLRREIRRRGDLHKEDSPLTNTISFALVDLTYSNRVVSKTVDTLHLLRIGC